MREVGIEEIAVGACKSLVLVEDLLSCSATSFGAPSSPHTSTKVQIIDTYL